MAFDSLSTRLQDTLKKIKGQGKISEANIETMLKEVRVALLEADVNFKVVKEFIANIKAKSLGQEVLRSITPGQMIVKIVNDELKELFGGSLQEIIFKENPTVIMMVGLQGAGKTTTAGKLSKLIKTKYGKKPLLVAADIYRPAAINQLVTLGQQIDVDVFEQGQIDPKKIVKSALEYAKTNQHDLIIIDTAGRLHINEELMDELVDIKALAKPTEILLTVDALTGQDAVNVAQSFNDKLSITGAILTKLDGDSRGGAALSIKYITGVPIKFIGTGEKLDALDLFHPDRMADRILGMGDVLTLIEKASNVIDDKKVEKLADKMMSGQFDLEDMLEQMKQVQKLGSFSGIMKMMPGANKMPEIDDVQAKKTMKQTQAIILSMTPYERKNPNILKASRKERIAKGSGTKVVDVNRILKQYEQMKKMMKQMGSMVSSGKIPSIPGMGGKNPFRR